MLSHDTDFILTISDDADFASDFTLALSQTGSARTVRSVTYSDSPVFGAEPSAVVLDLRHGTDALVAYAADLSTRFPVSRLVGAGSPSDGSVVLKLVKSGVKDFLGMPVQAEELKGLLRQLESAGAESPRAQKGKLVTFYGPKGGSGVTLLLANLSVELAADPAKRVALLDFSPTGGDASSYLNVASGYALADLVENYTLLDASFLDGVMVKHPSGVKILSVPRDEREAPTVDFLNAIHAVLGLLRASHDFVLADASHVEPLCRKLLVGESDIVFPVGTPDVLSLVGLAHFMKKTRESGIDPKKVKILMNRCDSKSRIDTKEFEKRMQHPVSYRLPNDYSLCIEAVNTGRTIRSIEDRSELARRIGELASLVNEDANAPQAAAKPKGLFRVFN